MARGNSLKNQFDIFKRDKFTCQYCGRTPPEVKLELDHIIPVSQVGIDDFPNLITSCWECNRGKSNEPLGFTKTRADLAEERIALEEKERQLREYQRLRQEIRGRENEDLCLINDRLYEATGGDFILNDIGIRSFRNFLQTFPVEKILDAMEIAIGKVTKLSGDNITRYTYGILHNWRKGMVMDGTQKTD